MNDRLVAITPRNAIWPHPDTFTPLETRPDRPQQGVQLLGDPSNAKGQVLPHTRYMLANLAGQQTLIIRCA